MTNRKKTASPRSTAKSATTTRVATRRLVTKPATPATKRVPLPVADMADGETGKHKKAKTVRDSFNMPDYDYALIGALKKRALAAAREVKKSELLRAGLKQLAKLGEVEFFAALKSVDTVKTGRPRKKK